MQPIRILVIDDDHDLRENLSELLIRKGYQVEAAANGRLGLEAAQRNHPHLILSDIMMPEMDGYAVLEHLSKDPATASIPFILLSACTDRADIRRGMGLGADDYLTKPFEIKELLEAIKIRLKRREMSQTEARHRMDELVQSISTALPHELNTPLSGILGFSSLILMDHQDDPEGDDYQNAKSIKECAERLQRTIANILLYAELELNPEDRKLAPENYLHGDFSALVEGEAIRSAERHQRESDLKLTIEEIPCRIPMRDFSKMVGELLDNAFKFSAPGSPVWLRCRFKTPWIEVRIRDQGIGMNQFELDHIAAYIQFGRRIREQQGSGLGITIARRLAELYGGQILFESTPGKGTTALLQLPAG